MKTKNSVIPSKYNKYALLTLFICLFLLYNCTNRESLSEHGICAHRGASNTHPENTLAAFKEAIRLGAHMIEFDVRMTKDSELIIMHDKTVDRTTDGIGKVSDLTLAELRKLDAGSWKGSKFSGEKIPLFSDVIDIMPRNTWLNIHIKGDRETAYWAAEIIVAKNRMHQAIFACKPEAADKIRQVSDLLFLCNMDRGNSAKEYVDNTITMNYEFIQLTSRTEINLPELVSKLKENNIRINYYGTDSKEKFISLMNSDVDFILTNNLNELIQVSEELGIKPVKPKFD